MEGLAIFLFSWPAPVPLTSSSMAHKCGTGTGPEKGDNPYHNGEKHHFCFHKLVFVKTVTI